MDAIAVLKAKLALDVADYLLGFGKAEDTANKFASTCRDIGRASAVAFGAITGAVYATVNEFGKLEDATVRLSIAAKASGQAIDVEGIRSYADALEKTTTFSNNETIAAAGMMASFKLTGDEIMKLIPHVQDIAAFMGTDLTSAASNVGRAVEGGSRSFRSMGIILTESQKAAFDAADSHERVAMAVQLLTDKVGGAAEALAQTSSGAMAQAKNAAERLMTAIGEVLAKPAAEFFQTLTEKIQGTTEWFSKLTPETKEFATYAAEAGIGATAVATGLSAILVSGNKVYGILKSITVIAGTMAGSIATIVAAFVGAGLLAAVGEKKLGQKAGSFSSGIVSDSILEGLYKTQEEIEVTQADWLYMTGQMEKATNQSSNTWQDATSEMGVSIAGIEPIIETKIKNPFDDVTKAIEKTKKAAGELKDELMSWEGFVEKMGLPKMSSFDIGVAANAPMKLENPWQEQPTQAQPELANFMDLTFKTQMYQPPDVSYGKKIFSQLEEGGATFAAQITSGMGVAGQAISAALQNVGDPINMAAAAAAAIVMNMKGFQRIIKILNSLLAVVTKTIEPVLNTIAGILKTLQPVLELLIKFHMALFGFSIIMKGLNVVMKSVSGIIEGFVDAVTKAWNWIIKKLANFVDAIPGLGGLAKKIRKNMIDVDKESKQKVSDELANRMVVDAMNMGKLIQHWVTDQIPEIPEKTKEDVRDFGEELSNVAKGFKYELRKFEATKAVSTGIGGSTTNESKGGINIGNIYVEAISPQQAWEAIKEAMNYDSFRRTGTSNASVPVYAGSGG